MYKTQNATDPQQLIRLARTQALERNYSAFADSLNVAYCQYRAVWKKTGKMKEKFEATEIILNNSNLIFPYMTINEIIDYWNEKIADTRMALSRSEFPDMNEHIHFLELEYFSDYKMSFKLKNQRFKVYGLKIMPHEQFLRTVGKIYEYGMNLKRELLSMITVIEPKKIGYYSVISINSQS